MRLFNSIGPNPRIVRMAAAEKGIALDLVEVDVLGGENRREAFLALNPFGSLPVLETDGGAIVTETLAIVEYLEELNPAPPLVGANPEARAATRMWTRRIDLGFAVPLTLGFRAAEGRAMFEPRMIVPPADAAPLLKAMAFDLLDLLERECADRAYVVGGEAGMADLLLFAFVEFARAVGIDAIGGRAWLSGWRERMAARPSASA